MNIIPMSPVTLFAILLAASCSGGGSDTSPTFLGRSSLSNPSLTSSSTSTSPTPPSTIPPGPSSGAPPTHDYEGSMEQALLTAAVLDGTLDCLWASHDGERTVLVLPEGSRTVQDGDEVVLVHRDGNEIARTGDRIDIVGGFAEGVGTCGAADPTTSSFLVGRIRRDE